MRPPLLLLPLLHRRLNAAEFLHSLHKIRIGADCLDGGGEPIGPVKIVIGAGHVYALGSRVRRVPFGGKVEQVLNLEDPEAGG